MKRPSKLNFLRGLALDFLKVHWHCGAIVCRAFFAVVSRGKPCTLWGEDDTRRVCAVNQIDVEFRNPLYDPSLAALWRR